MSEAETDRIAAFKQEQQQQRQRKQSRETAQIEKGKRNIYVCDECFGHIVTIDLVEGVTPFMLQCRATAECKGAMQSSMYRVFDQRMEPGFEWYRPGQPEKLRADIREHVRKGGLLLRARAES